MTAAIVGVYEHPKRLASEYTALRFIAESAKAALDDSGLPKDAIDGLCVAGDAMAAVYVAEYLDLRPTWLDTTSIGGSAFLSHIHHAADAIARGSARAVLIVYGSIARSGGARFGSRSRDQSSDPMAVDDYESFLNPYGVPLAAQYALVASAHMHRYGTTSEQLAEIAVTFREHAASNPHARYRDPITVADVLAARRVATPLGVLDCCVITDGGGAVILAAPEVVADCKTKPAWVLGGAEALGHVNGGNRQVLDTAASTSGPRAFVRAGIRHDDVDLCMIYDLFTISTLTALEGLGFCKEGEGGPFVENGRLSLWGSLPTNLDGGALSSNHPGRRGLFLAVEATRQLRGEANRQVPGARTAVCHGTGGYLNGRHSSITVVLGSDRP